MEILLLILAGYLLLKREKLGEGFSYGKISYEELQTDIARVQSYWPSIVIESIRAGVNPCIIAGIIHRESQGNPALVVTGKPPTYGLMQIQERTARASGLKGSVSNLLNNPEVNIKVGVNYYAAQEKRYRGDSIKAISAYNAGHATTKNKDYVQDVVELSNVYCQLSPSALPVTP